MRVPVLLVEDNFADAELVREAIEDADGSFELHVVEDGVEALTFLKREGVYAQAPTPRLMLLDLNTPRFGGYELLAVIRAAKAWADMRVVVFSSLNSPEGAQRALELGADAYEAKPADWDAFSETVRRVFTRWGEPSVGIEGDRA